MVEISGKGVSARTRALLLSGAFGGLLGAMPSGRFLEAANNPLGRHGGRLSAAPAVQTGRAEAGSRG